MRVDKFDMNIFFKKKLQKNLGMLIFGDILMIYLIISLFPPLLKVYFFAFMVG